MINISNNFKDLNNNLKKELVLALKNPHVKAIVVNLNLEEKVAMKYTSKLESCALELANCENCSGLSECKNKIEGYVYYPKVYQKQLIFSYVACKYKKQELQEIRNNASENNKIRMKDIDITDKKRIKVIKWLKNFYDTYKKHSGQKGLYLHGSFGCGKTFLISALLNELELKRINTCIIYFPEMLRDLKGDFDNFGAKMDYYQNVDILLIDDIGAEKVTTWGRDEILGTILQYRMQNKLTTFFTSNLTISELEEHLSLTNYSEDHVKARRIIERIKQLSEDICLISDNKRK